MRLLAPLAAAAVFAVVALSPPEAAAQGFAGASTYRASHLASPFRRSPIPSRVRIASRADVVSAVASCLHLGCRGFFIVGVGF
jgi:hypothetical protein